MLTGQRPRPPRHPRTRTAVLAGLAALIVITPITGVSTAAAEPAATTITIGPHFRETGPGEPAEPIEPTVIGGNHRWIDSGLGMWNAENDQPVDSAVTAGRGGHVGLVRYPGGTVANMFDFTRAVGDDRSCQIGAGFIGGLFAGQDSSYGPDEQQRYVDAIGAQTMIMVPMINQSAQDAADYVEYMNAPVGTNPNGGIAWAERRAANGHPAPYKINTWEVGNEPYFANQRYWRSTDESTKLQQFIDGGAERQTEQSPAYTDNDGLFGECDRANRVTGDGTADQSYYTRYNPIRDPELTVDGERWQLVDDLHDQPAGAKVYRIDAEDGRVIFGDGDHGTVPADGAELAIEYTTEQDGFVDYYRAIKEVDPSVSVCSGWGRAEFIQAMGKRAYDCIGFHMYTSPRAGDEETPQYDAEQLYHRLMPLGAEAVGKLDGLHRALAQQWPDPHRRPELLVTEWGTLVKPSPTGETMPFGYGAMLMRLLYDTELTMGLLENGVQQATKSNLNDGPPKDGKPPRPASVIGGAPHFFVTGGSQVMQLVHSTVSSRVLTTSLAGNPAATGGDYQALRAVSTRDRSGVVRVLVINRDLGRSVPATLALPGAGGGGQLTVTTLTGTAIDAYDSWDDPDQITQQVSHQRVTSPRLKHSFAPHSVTLLEFRDR